METNFIKTYELKATDFSEILEFIEKRGDSGPPNIFNSLKKDLASKEKAILLRLNSNPKFHFDAEKVHLLGPLIGDSLGDLLVQNEAGDRVISVYDRDRLGSMHKGGRYHQTREGGSIHTDNVNIPEAWDYLLLSCLSPGLVGGESILVDGVAVYKELKDNFPKALKVLEGNFIWEMRGVKDELYRAPIITYNEEGEPLYRHLRPYMESAHFKAEEPLTEEQLYAIDVLDALTNSSRFQQRIKLVTGDILVTKDAQVLHGRTCFSDELGAVSFEEKKVNPNLVMKRTMERLWIRK